MVAWLLCGFVLASWQTPAGPIDLTPGFDPGPPPEMRRLAFLIGTWRVTPEFAGPGGTWTPTTMSTSTFAPTLGGAFITSSLTVVWPGGEVSRTESTWSYDRFRREYRVGFFNDLWDSSTSMKAASRRVC